MTIFICFSIYHRPCNLNQIEYLGRVSTKRLSLADYHPICPGCRLPCLHNSRSEICHVLSEDPFVDHFKTVDSQRNHLPSSSGGSMAPMVRPKRVPMAALESHQSTRPRGFLMESFLFVIADMSVTMTGRNQMTTACSHTVHGSI